MLKALYTSATGMKVQETSVDVVANNLANANTTGFKRSQADFQDLLYVQKERPGVSRAQGIESPTGLQIGSGARVVSTTKVFSQGVLEETHRELDLAIQGDGFFEVQRPDGSSGYTRDGSFRLNAQGQLVTNTGYTLVPQLAIPADAMQINVGEDGTVSVVSASDPSATNEIGQISLVRFPNPAGLSSEGGNLFAETPASGTPTTGSAGTAGNGSLAQGFLERSNVEVVNELVNLIIAQRAYEMNSRSIRSGDQMLSAATNLVG